MQSEIFKAFEKTRLIVGDKKESQYSRCGRTDKGVSSVGQVPFFIEESHFLYFVRINSNNDLQELMQSMFWQKCDHTLWSREKVIDFFPGTGTNLFY